jgi:hypothetical protein
MANLKIEHLFCIVWLCHRRQSAAGDRAGIVQAAVVRHEQTLAPGGMVMRLMPRSVFYVKGNPGSTLSHAAGLLAGR